MLGLHDAWDEIRRRHEQRRTVPARLVARVPGGFEADVFGQRALLCDDAIVAGPSRLDVGATVEAWVLKFDLDRGTLELHLLFDRDPG